MFKHQSPQRYIVRISNKREEVWEIHWAICWRKTHTMKMVSNRCTLVVARNVLTNETKFFISNRVPGSNGWSLRKTLKVAFSRWPVEDCFREAKEELGLDHFECRSWKCIHRHYLVTLLGHLFCAHARKKLSKTEDVISDDYLAVEQVRRSVNANLAATTDPPRVRASKHKAEYDIQSYYQKRNAFAIECHRKKRRAALKALGINLETTKSMYDTEKRRSKPRRLALSNYASAVCSPTRVSLLSGMNVARHRVTSWTLRKDRSPDQASKFIMPPKWNLNGVTTEADVDGTTRITPLPALLKAAGYRTIHVGKAHFGAKGMAGGDPQHFGFDVNIAGHAAGGPGSYWGEKNFSAAWRNEDRIWDVPGLELYHGQDVYLTEALTREAIKAVESAVKDGEPFYLYLSHYAVHAPWEKDNRFYQNISMQG